VLFEKALFRYFCLFAILIIPQSTTQGSRQKNIVKLQHHEQNDIILTKK